jgi:ABC-2 type transport system ATP-binding protein
MIEVKHLTKRYGNHTAVDDLSFQIEEGKIYGLLGPNGAGKSTTMNMLTGYLGASSGEILINGHDIVKEPEEAKKQMGYLPELPPVYDAMTTAEYLAFVAELKQIKKEKRQEQIQEVMELTKITDVKDRLIQNLSKGYKQRVGLAQAILGDPEIIILDEPTVGLDPMQIIEIRELIKSLGKKHTVILSSHILPEVSAVCDHIMIISQGRLVASDTAEGLARLMTGDNELALKVRIGGKEAGELAQELASSLKEITNYTLEADAEPNLQKITLHYDKDVDLREKVFHFFAEKNTPLYGIELSVKTLEDVFLELTRQNVNEDAEGDKRAGKRKAGFAKRKAEQDDTEQHEAVKSETAGQEEMKNEMTQESAAKNDAAQEGQEEATES